MNRKKFRLKKFEFHPITTFIILIFVVMILSSILSFLSVRAPYYRIDASNTLVKTPAETIKGLFNFDGFKFLIESAAKNFAAFTPLRTLLIALVGLSVAHASGFIDTFIKRVTLQINNKTITFIIIFLATISSIINEVGYVVLIPLSALVFLANGRNPLIGITAAFCGVAFGYGVTLFAGSMEMSLVQLTEKAAMTLGTENHVALLSNLYAIVLSTIVLSIVGTSIIENVVSKKIGRYHLNSEDTESETKEIKIETVEEEQQKKLEEDIREKKGLKYALIAFIVFVLIVAYMLIPNLPGSGLLLDMNEKAYINQVFGQKAYFQKGFTFLISYNSLFIFIFYYIFFLSCYIIST